MYYVVKIGRHPGIYESWSEAEKHVTGYSGAKYKSFKMLTDAEAWLTDSNQNQVTQMQVNPIAKDVNIQVNIQVDIQVKADSLIIRPLNKQSMYSYDCSKLNMHSIITTITENTTKPVCIPNTWTEYDGSLYIFTDGSYKKSSNTAGAGIYFGDSGVSIKLPDGFTNNQAELIGILYALQQIKINTMNLAKYSVTIISDSMYCINIVTKWMATWQKNNWKKSTGEDILNLELIQAINTLWRIITLSYQGSISGQIKFEHQTSHTTAPVNKQSREYMLWYGNNMADMLATN